MTLKGSAIRLKQMVGNIAGGSGESTLYPKSDGKWYTRSGTGAESVVGPQSKTDVGLGSVDNTSDVLKPLSTAATNALAGKLGLSDDYNAGHHPEGRVIANAYLANDLANLRLRGGSVSVTGATLSNAEIDTIFDGTASFVGKGAVAVGSPIVLTITLPRALRYTSYLGVGFGNTSWRSNTIRVEAYSEGVWKDVINLTANTSEDVFGGIPSNSGVGTTQIRVTFADATSLRICHIWGYAYDSALWTEAMMPRKGGTFYGEINAPTVKQNSVQVVTTTDARLSDARTPLAHNHDSLYADRFPKNGILGRLAASRRGPVKMVALGSSTIAGTGASTDRDEWVNQFARGVQSAFPSGVAEWEPPVMALSTAAATPPNLPGVHVINGGVGGTTVSDYCGSAQRSYIDTLDPVAILHMIGANDFGAGTTPTAYKAGLISVLDALDALVPNMIHIICDTYARPDVQTPAYAWSLYVTAMREVVEARTNAIFISMLPEWEKSGVAGYNPTDPLRLTKWRTNSDIHPSNAGHSLIAALVLLALQIPTSRQPIRPEVVDRFQRSALGSAETGQPWELQSGVFAPTGGALKVTTGGNAVVNTGFSDAEVSALVTHSSAANVGIFAKSDSDTTRVAVYLIAASDRVEIFLGAVSLGFSPALGLVSGREYFLKLSVSGDKVVAELDGVEQATATLTSGQVAAYASYTKHGVRSGVASSVVKWRQFSVRSV